MASTKEKKKLRDRAGREKTPLLARSKIRLVIYVGVHLLSAGFVSGLFWMWTGRDVPVQQENVVRSTPLNAEEAIQNGQGLR